MLITVDLPEDVLRRAEEVAAQRGCTLSQLVTDALRRWLGDQSLVDFMRSSPLADHDEIELDRNPDPPRESGF